MALIIKWTLNIYLFIDNINLSYTTYLMDTCTDNLMCFTSWSVQPHQTMDIFFSHTKMCLCWQPQPAFPQNNRNSPTKMCPSRSFLVTYKMLRFNCLVKRFSEDWVMCTTLLNPKLQHTPSLQSTGSALPL